MATRLTKEEVESLGNLEKNFDKRLEEYRQQKEKEPKEDLENELEKLSSYLDGCYRSEIDDVVVNIRFCAAKIEVLKKILGVHS